MRKKIVICIAVAAVLLLLGIVWYRMPVSLPTADSEDIGRIYIFDGRTGKSADIRESWKIERIVEDLKGVTLKREGISLGYMDVGLRITLYDASGKEVRGWSKFKIKDAGNIRKDPFFYRVVGGEIDLTYIESLLKKMEKQ